MHWLPVAAVAVLLINDHALKGADLLPTWLTGKLSDIAGLLFFPILLARLAQASAQHVAALRTRNNARLAALCVAATGIVFATLKLSSTACAWAAEVWGTIICDPTDLLALPALVAAYLHITQVPQVAAAPVPGRLVRWSERAWLCVAALASIATQAPEPPPFVAWQAHGSSELRAGCARLQIWTSKSGKTGAGFSIALAEPAPTDDSCRVVFEQAELSVAARKIEAQPPPVALRELSLQGTYLAFLFDNEAAWNSGERHGSLRLQLRVGGEAVVLVIPLNQVWQKRSAHDENVQRNNQYLAKQRVDAGFVDAGSADAEGSQ